MTSKKSDRLRKLIGKSVKELNGNQQRTLRAAIRDGLLKVDIIGIIHKGHNYDQT